MNESNVCPCCNRRLPKQRPMTARAPEPVDLSALSSVDLYAHYRRTAPQEDLRFYARGQNTPPAWRERFEALADLLEASRAADTTRKRDAWKLIDQYKAESEAWVPNEAAFWAKHRETIAASQAVDHAA